MKSRSFNLLVILALFLSLLGGAVTVNPAYAVGRCYVKANAAGSNNGVDWTNAYTSLQSAIADTCTEIWVAAGTYKPHASNPAVSFALENGTAIYGGFAGTETLLSQRNIAANVSILSGDLSGNDNAILSVVEPTRAENSYHVVVGTNTNNTAVLDGFTITSGNAIGPGLTGSRGGGMYNNNGNPTLVNVIFTNNTASIIGSGMSNDNASPSLKNVTFSSNDVVNYGGGMSNDNGSNPTLMNVTFSGNKSYAGGGMVNDNNSNPTLTNVTFSGNTASVLGGGLWNWNSSNPILINVTFSGNSAPTGGGMYNNSSSSPTLTNVIIANSTSGGDCFNDGTTLNISSSNNLIDDSTCGLTDGTNGNKIGATYNVNLGALANNGGFTQTMSLQTGSDAIDAGANCAATDQRGVARPQGAGCDIGAFELDTTYPSVVTTSLQTAYSSGPANFTINFSENLNDPLGDADIKDATNPANYLVVEKGINGLADTLSCAGGVKTDDTNVPVNSVTFNPSLFTATVNFASALPNGSYRLFVCGTTSIRDNALNALNGGTSDFTFDFTVGAAAAASSTTENTRASSLPKTGFAPNKITTLPEQPANSAYAALGDLWLEIPSLNVKSTIVGVPQNADKTWDVSWLGNDTGWLNGTAFPTWNGNSVLTAHVTNASGVDGPFAALKTLKYGDQVIVHMGGVKYVYEIRSIKLARPYSTSFAFESLQDHSYLTLITCQGYNPLNESYLFRRVVRAVLVEVK